MSHAPKQQALEAYAEGLLSEAGEARVQRHLASCSTCRDALTAIHAYRSLRREAAQEELFELSWERLSSALDKEAAPAPAVKATPQRSGRMVALIWPVLAVAAAVLIGWIGLSSAPSNQRTVARVPSIAQKSREAPTAMLRGWVTLISGSAFLERAGQRAPLTLDSEVREGDVIFTEANAQAHVALRADTGFVLGEKSQLAITQLRESTQLLALHSGSLSNHVKKLTASERYEVSSQEFTASVRGTRFVVERREGFRVFVYEGAVAISRGNQQVAYLKPGQRFEAPKPERESAAPADLTPHALSLALAELRPVQLPETRELGSWQVNGGSVSANGPLAMRAPQGPLQLSYRDPRGQLRMVELHVSEQGTTLQPTALNKLLAHKEQTAGYLEAEQIRKVIAKGLEPLRRCYERSLKVTPSLEGKLKLAMRVAPDGHVVRADATGNGKLPAELSRCIAQEAGRLKFPKPEGGGSVSFEVPLNLRSAR